MRSFFSILLVVFLSGCSRDAPKDSTFTLGTGISVVSKGECNPAQIGEASSIVKETSGYILQIPDAYICRKDDEPIFLSLTRGHKATLTIGRPSCECARAVKVKIVERLEPGDTLYILNGGEVSGHLLVP
jgi:hypothetical protein